MEHLTARRTIRAAAAVTAAALTLTACATESDDPDVPRASVTATDLDALTRSLNDTGFAMWRASLAEGENTVISPASISTAFGMVAAGASDPVDGALAGLFGYPVDGGALLDAFNAYERAIATRPDDAGQTAEGEPERATVEVANRVFLTDGFAPREEYLEEVARYFGAGAEQLPMQDDPDAAAEAINGWVEERTQGLIPELVSPDFFSDETVMALVNALYLKASWAQPFDEGATRDADFTRLDGSAVTVDMMHRDAVMRPVLEGEGFVATALPYAYDELDMVLVVPDEGVYAQVEQALGQGLLDDLDTQQPRAFDLAMPRFEATARTDLRSVVEGEMGVTNLFDTVGLDGIAPDLFVSDAVHAATVTVTEAGTEAAAATAIGIGVTSAPPEPDLEIRADRPFLYVIRDVDTGAVLFVGRVLDPAA